jgi:hypothetical protein
MEAVKQAVSSEPDAKYLTLRSSIFNVAPLGQNAESPDIIAGAAHRALL